MTKNVSGNAFRVVRDAIDSYRRQADKEPWQIKHNSKMNCRDLEDWLYVGNGIFDAITAFDEKHQNRVFTGEIQFDPEHSNAINDAYSWWLGPCDGLTAKIETLRKKGFHVEYSEQFLSNCREAKGILTDDAEFFNDVREKGQNELHEFRSCFYPPSLPAATTSLGAARPAWTLPHDVARFQSFSCPHRARPFAFTSKKLLLVFGHLVC